MGDGNVYILLVNARKKTLEDPIPVKLLIMQSSMCLYVRTRLH